MNIKCRRCEEILPPSQYEKNRKTCRTCRKKYKAKHKKKCEFCGKYFRTAKKTERFCNAKCFSQTRVVKVERNCAYCGNKVKMIPSVKAKNSVSYCNQECRTLHLKEVMTGENNPNYNQVEKACDGCGKNTLFHPFLLKSLKHNFCSNKCFRKNIGKFYSGSNNSNWNRDLSLEERLKSRRYPEYYEWRKNVYERDCYTCKCCGSSKSGTLNAHHIENYKNNKEKRTDVNNGITLCKDCHKFFHKRYGYFNNNSKQLNEFLKLYQDTLV